MVLTHHGYPLFASANADSRADSVTVEAANIRLFAQSQTLSNQMQLHKCDVQDDSSIGIF